MQRPEKEILAIIPARSGSTEVKNKNIRLLGGKPLLYYTIKASIDSSVNRTIVSTDSQKIKKIAERLGAEVPFLRPKKYATTRASSMSVILHCLNYLKKKEEYIPDYVVFLQPTSPFRSSDDINKGIRIISNARTISLAGIVEASQHPFWMFTKNKRGKLHELIKKKNKPQRRQDLPDIYYFNDSLYISKIEFFNSASASHPIVEINDMVGIEMSQLHSFDINTELDFEIAKKMAKFLK